MPERDGYIPGVPCWVDTSQPDSGAAVDFYSGLFGWECENVMPEDSPGKYYVGRIRGLSAAAIGSVPESMPDMAMWNTYIAVDSADEIVGQVEAAGGETIMPPFDVMDAGRMAVFTDTEGAFFGVWQAHKHRGAQIVNEHGAVNFNNLYSRDPEAARRFYNAVFGWNALDVGGSFWTLPAHGDHLEELTPGIREGMRERGAPEGFLDVVAALNPIPEHDLDQPASWGVTFSVDDADATAARATELGGQVLVPPVDAPWVRMTILADPQGATLTASTFVPENASLPAPD